MDPTANENNGSMSPSDGDNGSVGTNGEENEICDTGEDVCVATLDDNKNSKTSSKSDSKLKKAHCELAKTMLNFRNMRKASSVTKGGQSGPN